MANSPGTVANRTTMPVVVFMVSDTGAYPPAAWLIDPDLSGLGGVPQKYWIVVGGAIVEMTQPEKDAVDAADLAQAKADKVDELNGNTQQLIEDNGCEYPTASGNIFALDEPSRLYWNELDLGAAGLAYPVVVVTKDGFTEVSLADAAAVHAFFMVGCVVIRDWEDSAQPFFLLVVAATTVAQVEAIVDTRM